MKDLKNSAVRFALALVLFLIVLRLPNAVGSILTSENDLVGKILRIIPFRREITNFLFFWPQMALFPNGLTIYVNGDAHYYLYEQAIYLGIVFWLLIGIAHSRITRNWRLLFSGLSVYPMIFVTTFFMTSLLRVFGVFASLDGP